MTEAGSHFPGIKQFILLIKTQMKGANRLITGAGRFKAADNKLLSLLTFTFQPVFISRLTVFGIRLFRNNAFQIQITGFADNFFRIALYNLTQSQRSCW